MEHSQASELKMCHGTIAQLEAKNAILEAKNMRLESVLMEFKDRHQRLEGMITDYEDRLQRQEDQRILSEEGERRKDSEFDKIIKGYEGKMGDMMLHVRTRDRQLMATEKQLRNAHKDLHEFHKRKHEMVGQAKREEREAIRRENAASNGRNGGQNGQNGSSGTDGGGSTCGNLGMGEPKGAVIGRTSSSGTLLTRAPGFGVNGGTRAKTAGGAVAEPPKQADQIRATCVENNLKEFFQLP